MMQQDEVYKQKTWAGCVIAGKEGGGVGWEVENEGWMELGEQCTS